MIKYADSLNKGQGPGKILSQWVNAMHETKPEKAAEDPLEIPLDRLNPDTLRNMIVEFVTREWEELSGLEYTLDDKVEQVLRQLKSKQARIVFDCMNETWNIIPCR